MIALEWPRPSTRKVTWYSDLRRFEYARRAFDEARALWEAVGDRRGLALTLLADARLRERRGEYEDSLNGYEQAFALFERMGDPIWSASCLAGQAQIYQYLAETPKALDLFQKALRIAETSGLKSFEWDMLNNVGAAFLASGDEAAAVDYFQKAYAVGTGLANPRQQAWALTYLGGAHLARGSAESARESFDRALSILPGVDEPWLFAQTLAGLGETAAATGQTDAALAYLDKAVNVSQSAGDRLHTAMGRMALGRLAARQGRLASASTSLTEALKDYSGLFTREHPLVADTRATLASVDFWSGRTAEALTSALTAEAISLDHLRTTVRYLPERQALAFASKRPRGLDLAVSAATGGSGSLRARVYDLVIQARGAVLDELAARKRIPAPSDAGLATSTTALHARQRYANLLVRSLEGTIPQSEFEAARYEKELAERALAAESADARAEMARTPPGLDAVRSALPGGAALISFVQYARHERPARGQAPPPAVPSVVAFVIRPGITEPAMIPIGEAATIDRLLSDWRREAAGGSALLGVPPDEADTKIRIAGTRLRQVVWDPVAPQLRGATRLFVVPDGALSLLPWGALPSVTKGFLQETVPPIHYLTTERDLIAAVGRPRALGAGMLALGGPDFDGGADVVAISAHEADAGAEQTENLRRAGVGACSTLQSLRFQPLNGTLEEVREVARLMPGPAGAAKTLVGREANEPAFKREADHYRILHLATHGFFLDGSCVLPTSVANVTRGVGGLASGARTVDNPLLLSGLALAGANRRAQARADEDDGILTAEEVASLDLGGVEWAVLSACDTGVGEIKAGEGVFGLRRAFQVAGARTVVMSLWSVEDQSTRAWMRALYEGRFERHLSTADAVHQASLTVLRDRRAQRAEHASVLLGSVRRGGDWR